MTELYVTNFNKNFTGVSATAAGVVGQQRKQFNMKLVGQPLPGCPVPISVTKARALSRIQPKTRPFSIWHVRRNTEMRVAIWARDVLGLPIKIVFTSAAIRRHSAFPRWLINRMDAVIATTESAARYVPHVRAVVPHGVDTERFSPARDRAAAWRATGYPGDMGLATIGRIRPEKGTDRFVAAMLRVLPDHPGLTALVVGRASKSHQSFLDGLRRQVDAAGLGDRLLFPGEVAPDALPAVMQGLSAVVQLPRYEGYGMAPLEGMASGVPFVATDAGYYRAFSGDGACGTIVPEDDTAATVAAISDIIFDPQRLDIMSQSSRAATMGQFSIRAEAAGIGAVYDQLWQQS